MDLEKAYNFVEIAGFYPSESDAIHKKIITFLINNCLGIPNISNYYSKGMGAGNFYLMSKIYSDFYSYTILSNKTEERLYLYPSLEKDLLLFKENYDLINEFINPYENHKFFDMGRKPILDLNTNISNNYAVLFVEIPFKQKPSQLKSILKDYFHFYAQIKKGIKEKEKIMHFCKVQ